MDYSKLVPSRELCHRMQELGICQDDPELWYCKSGQYYHLGTLNQHNSEKDIIAPTLSRMIEGLPDNTHVSKIGFVCGEKHWRIMNPSLKMIQFDDNSLPNAIAKALIAIKESHV